MIFPSLSEICRNDLRIGKHLRSLSLAQERSEIEHRKTLAYTGHELHIVLDKEDRHIEFVAHKANRLHKLRSLVRVHSRGGLIEKKKLRRGCKRARYLKLALLSVRKVAGEVIALVLKVEHREKLHRALVHLTLIGKMTGRRNTASAADADIEL